MIKLDLKDRKILYELDINSRQSFSKIGKKVGLHRNQVKYRVNNLVKRGVITKFLTPIDASTLGYNIFRIYVVFQRTNKEIEEDIIKHFIEYKNSWAVCLGKVRYDLIIHCFEKDFNDFFSFWKKTLIKYRNYFKEQILSLYRNDFYPFLFLISDKNISEKRKQYRRSMGGGNKKIIDQIDASILRLIVENSRMKTIEIASKINISTNTVNKRIKNLIDVGVIKGFNIEIDLPKLGYYVYCPRINLTDYLQRQKIISYITTNPKFIRLDDSIGCSDLELELAVKSPEEFHEIMDDLIRTFPETIQDYTYFYIEKVYKKRYIPKDI